jgi:hypothetical protein
MCEPPQCTLIEFALDSTEKRYSCYEVRVVPSASSDGRGLETEDRRIFLLWHENQQCDERAIPDTTYIKTHRA